MPTPSARKVVLLVVAGCACAFASLTFRAVPVARAAEGLSPDWQRGANVTTWWHDTYGQPEAEQSLEALRVTGTTSAALIVTWYMDGQSSSSIQPDASRTPSDAGILELMAKARSLGMSIALKPQIDVRDGTFRGNIAPADRLSWWADYRSMIYHYADLARQGQADALIVGTELTTLSGDTDQWRSIISDVRSRFEGKLTFAANWVDAARKVSFWPDLDYMGIDAYMPLVWSDPNPSVDVLAAAWCGNVEPSGTTHHYVDEIATLQAQYQKPVVFTELGYESRYGTAASPWGGAAGPISQEPQARAYEAAYRVWSRIPWFKGIYWWQWPAASSSSNPADGSYAPVGKLAQATMTAWSTAPAEPASGGPCATADAGAKPAPGHTVITLRAKVARRQGRHRLRGLAGQVRRRGVTCAKTVVVRIDRWDRRRHAWRRRRTFRSKSGPDGRYSATSPRRLRQARYRARSAVSGGPCAGTSRYKRFKIR